MSSPRRLRPLRFLLRSWRRLSPAVAGPIRSALLPAILGISLAVGGVQGGPAAWEFMREHSYFRIPRVEVAGHRRLDRTEVLRWVDLPDGSSVWNADPKDLRARLLRHPWVGGAEVSRELPNHVAIRIRERTPVAIVRLGGELFYLGRGARVLGPLTPEDSRDFPILTGLDTVDRMALAGVQVQRALQLLRWCDRLLCFDEISEVRIDAARGLTVIPRRDDVEVVLGWGRWREKLQRSARVFEAWSGQTNRLARIDVSLRSSVVVRLREEPPAPSGGRRRGVAT